MCMKPGLHKTSARPSDNSQNSMARTPVLDTLHEQLQETFHCGRPYCVLHNYMMRFQTWNSCLQMSWLEQKVYRSTLGVDKAIERIKGFMLELNSNCDEHKLRRQSMTLAKRRD